MVRPTDLLIYSDIHYFNQQCSYKLGQFRMQHFTEKKDFSAPEVLRGTFLFVPKVRQSGQTLWLAGGQSLRSWKSHKKVVNLDNREKSLLCQTSWFLESTDVKRSFVWKVQSRCFSVFPPFYFNFLPDVPWNVFLLRNNFPSCKVKVSCFVKLLFPFHSNMSLILRLREPSLGKRGFPSQSIHRTLINK